MNKNDLQEIEDILKHQLGVFAEGINHKLDLVIEGHQFLAQKIDAVAKDISEHRADTEIHRGYKVSDK